MKPYQWILIASAITALGCGKGKGDGSAGGGSQAAPGSASPPRAAASLTFSVISHGGAGDSFWDVVKNGAEAAGKDLGVAVEYQGSGDPLQQSQMIDTAVSKKVAGIVVSMANPDALKEAIAKAVQAGIPVVTINSGEARSKELGALAHVGQPEEIAGEGAGAQLKAAGVTKLVCVIHEAGNVGLEQRCAGAKVGLGGTIENLQVDIGNVADASAKVKAKLEADPKIDGLLSLNPAIAIAARDAVRDSGSKAKVATFDVNSQVLEAIKAGQILFAVDQQPYLQGYLPVVLLKLYKTNANVVGGGKPVLTGPGFVTKDNAATIESLAAGGTR